MDHQQRILQYFADYSMAINRKDYTEAALWASFLVRETKAMHEEVLKLAASGPPFKVCAK